MRYCLSSTLSAAVLAKADEIKVHYKDIETLPKLIERFPDKTFVVTIPFNAPVDWTELKNCNMLAENDLICACEEIQSMQLAKANHLKFYYDFNITSYFELNALIEMGVCEILIGIPLCFDLPTVKTFNIPVRMVANIAYDPYLEHSDGICGQWIRPEDVPVYEQYVQTLEFRAFGHKTKEETLFHIYAENGFWPTDLSVLIDGLDFPCENSAIPPELAEARVKCQHRCQVGKCYLCESALKYSNAIRVLDNRNKGLPN